MADALERAAAAGVELLPSVVGRLYAGRFFFFPHFKVAYEGHEDSERYEATRGEYYEQGRSVDFGRKHRHAEDRAVAERFAYRAYQYQRRREAEPHSDAVEHRGYDAVLISVGLRSREDDAVDDDERYEYPEGFVERRRVGRDEQLDDGDESRYDDYEGRDAYLVRYAFSYRGYGHVRAHEDRRRGEPHAEAVDGARRDRYRGAHSENEDEGRVFGQYPVFDYLKRIYHLFSSSPLLREIGAPVFKRGVHSADYRGRRDGRAGNGLYLVVGLWRGLGHGELLRELFLELSGEGGLHGLCAEARRLAVAQYLDVHDAAFVADADDGRDEARVALGRHGEVIALDFSVRAALVYLRYHRVAVLDFDGFELRRAGQRGGESLVLLLLLHETNRFERHRVDSAEDQPGRRRYGEKYQSVLYDLRHVFSPHRRYAASSPCR